LAELTPSLMNQKKIQFAKSIILLPILTSLANFSPMAFLRGEHTVSPVGSFAGLAASVPRVSDTFDKQYQALLADRAAKIDTYFHDRSMPLEGYGMAMVEAAERHDIDWRLLPAIAIRESSGGKQMCGNNPFGWGSCRIKFESLNEAIEILATNLGGDNPNTAHYYAGDTEDKLYRYNGTVIPTYTKEVLGIMDRIGTDDAMIAQDGEGAPAA